MQQTGDYQMALMYLLGLDWPIAADWQQVRERERTLDELRKAAGAGAFGSIIGKAADLRTQFVLADSRLKALQADLAAFKVLDEYRSLEEEASELTRELNALANQSMLDLAAIRDIEAALAAEVAPALGDLEQVYRAAGVELPPGLVKQRYDDVRAFHESVVRNRQSYLQSELTAARARIEARNSDQARFDTRRAEVMGILQSHAAHLADAIRAFEETSGQLYESAGSMLVEETQNGPQFKFPMQGSRSKGIKNMQIFCFDMMLMRLCHQRGIGPGFLVHDSHLFDGVDGRQVIRALRVGAQTANELGFQYLVTMNEDDAFKESEAGFNLGEYVLPVRLTDATEDGGLFGVRFD